MLPIRGGGGRGLVEVHNPRSGEPARSTGGRRLERNISRPPTQRVQGFSGRSGGARTGAVQVRAASTCRAAHAYAEEFHVDLRVGPLDENVIPIEYVYLDRLPWKEASHIVRPSRVGRVRIAGGVGDRDIGSDPRVTKENANPPPVFMPSPSMTLMKMSPILASSMFEATVNGHKSRIDPVFLPLKPTPNPRVS